MSEVEALSFWTKLAMNRIKRRVFIRIIVVFFGMKVKRTKQEPRIDEGGQTRNLIEAIRSGRLSREEYIKRRLSNFNIDTDGLEGYRRIYGEIYDVIARRKRVINL